MKDSHVMEGGALVARGQGSTGVMWLRWPSGAAAGLLRCLAALVLCLQVAACGPTSVPPTARLSPVPTVTPLPAVFQGEEAYGHVLAQVDLGPRPTGSEAALRTADYIAEHLRRLGWEVEFQDFTYRGTPCRNVIGRAGSGPIALIGAHYDTRRHADQDPDPARRTEPVLGANDGASGVAVLLELARALEPEKLSHEVWLVFFDAEDNGGLDGWEFIAGSRHFAANLAVEPEFVIIADMVGDADQQLYKERNSTPALQDRVWALAARLGYGEYFIDEYRWAMLDDHTPFLERGIPALDVIDFDYPYWHTGQDTADKVAPESLERVGRVVEVLLEGVGS
ncbi:MAG: M28 family peptidase [Anaerolineae bacterium]|nr:M28 family peptidase [Anaerolineae bacterium]